MRHLKHTAKLGRMSEHRNAMLANLVCSLIKHKRVTTTLAKAKAARPVAEKIVTLSKLGTLQARRLVNARLHTHGPTIQLSKDERRKWRQNEDVLRILFEEIAPAFKERNGGYTRIVKMDQRLGDGARRAILEWVDYTPPAPAPAESAPNEEAKPAETKPAEAKPTEAKSAETKPAKSKNRKK
jgi:large subunit ribosomal protein L17